MSIDILPSLHGPACTRFIWDGTPEKLDVASMIVGSSSEHHLHLQLSVCVTSTQRRATHWVEDQASRRRQERCRPRRSDIGLSKWDMDRRQGFWVLWNRKALQYDPLGRRVLRRSRRAGLFSLRIGTWRARAYLARTGAPGWTASAMRPCFCATVSYSGLSGARTSHILTSPFMLSDVSEANE